MVRLRRTIGPMFMVASVVVLVAETAISAFAVLQPGPGTPDLTSDDPRTHLGTSLGPPPYPVGSYSHAANPVNSKYT